MSIVKTVFGRLMITLGAVFVAFSSSAQTYPQRPIKAIVPYAAGGFSDGPVASLLRPCPGI